MTQEPLLASWCRTPNFVIEHGPKLLITSISNLGKAVGSEERNIMDADIQFWRLIICHLDDADHNP